MSSTESRSSSLAAQKREERYRRRFLRVDAQLSIKIIVFVTIAAAATTRNDFLLVRDRASLVSLLIVRVLVALWTGVTIWILARENRRRRHDFAYASWAVAIAILIVAVNVTRIPSAEVQGPLAACLVLTTVIYFALRGPIPYRVSSATVVSLSVFPLVWSSRASLSPAARMTSTIVIAALNIMGYVTASAFEEQRRKRFDAEIDEQRARRELVKKMAELAEEKVRAETLARARTAFLAVMSHEFRTPMNAVLGFSELLLQMHLDSKAHEYANSIRDSARGLLGLLNDVLDFAKIDADKLALASSPFDLKTLMTSVVAMMEPMVTSRSVTLELQASPDVPEFVLGDEMRLRQVLVNLLSNAVKFTEHGHVRLVVNSAPSTPTTSERQLVTFRVEDSGMGMDASVMARLFQPFEQGEQGITRRHQGTGLGLAITKRIVQAMGGDIQVESKIGKGSTFSFTISLEVTGPATPTSSYRGQHVRPELAIMVVDDHPINRRLAQAMFERLGYAVDLAEDGPSAIAAAAKKDYDVIFMDLHMPGMSGIEATKQILQSRSVSPTVHIVAMTASVFEEDREACRQAGMQGFVAKPIDLGQLQSILSRVSKKASKMNQDRASSSGFDRSALDMLRELEKVAEPGFVANLLRDFLGDVPQRLDRLRVAIEGGNAKNVEFEAHTLKSTCRAVGAEELAALCGQIEKAASAGDLTNSAEWVAALDAAFRRVEPVLAREMVKSG